MPDGSSFWMVSVLLLIGNSSVHCLIRCIFMSVAHGLYYLAMWMPETSSLFSSVGSYPVLLTTGTDKFEGGAEWQQWKLHDLLPSSQCSCNRAV